MNRTAAAIAAGIAALIGFVLWPILVATDKVPGIDAYHLHAFEVYTRSVLRSGRLPFWNPYYFSGMLHLADLQTQTLYPPALLLRWLPVPTFLSVMVAVHLWIAAIGGIVLARVLAVGWSGAAAAGIALALGGSIAPWIHNGHLLFLESTAWLPWIFALAILSSRRPAPMPYVGLVVACGLHFLTGNPTGTLYTAAALTGFYAFAIVRPVGASRQQLLAQWALTGLLAAGLVAFQLAPTAMLAREAGRTGGLSWAVASEGGWRVSDLARVFRPFSGLPATTAPYRLLSDSTVYVGILMALAAPLAFVSRERRRIAAFFALLGMAGIALAAADWLPFYRLHYLLFPGLRIPGRALFVTTLSLAVLGALGLDEMLRAVRRRSVAAARVAGVMAVALVAADLVAFAAPAIEPVRITVATPVVAAAAARSGGRVLTVCNHRVSAPELLLAGRPSLDGAPGLHLSRYADWADIARTGERPMHDGLFHRTGSDGEFPARRDLIDAANVGTVLACGPTTIDGLQLVDSDRVVNVYRNPSAWPRAIWTCSAESGPGDALMAELLHTPVSRDTVAAAEPVTAVESGGVGRASRSRPADPHGPEVLIGTRPCPDRALVQVLDQDRSDGRLTLRFDAPTDGIVFVSEAFFPERRAYLDGERVPTLKANVAFTALRVPAGQHQVELRYVPVSFYIGVGLTAITIGGWTAAGRRVGTRRA